MSTSSIRNRSLTRAHRLVFGAAINFFILVVLMPFAWLREQPAFWTNAGGWPIWFREFVGASFFPLFLLEFLLLVIFSGLCVQLLPKRNLNGNAVVVVLLLFWMLFFLVIVIFATNNLENLMTGRSAHWHAD